MDCSPPGTSVHGTSQTRILEWVVISFSRGSFLDPPDPGIEPVSPASPALQADSLPLVPLMKPSVCVSSLVNVLTSWACSSICEMGMDTFISRASQVVLVVKNLPASVGDIRNLGSIPVSGRSLGGGHGNPLQYSCLENPIDRGAWRTTVHGVAKSQTLLK